MSRRKIKKKKPSKRKIARYQEAMRQAILERRQQMIKQGTASPDKPASPTQTPEAESCAVADDLQLEKERVLEALKPSPAQ